MRGFFFFRILHIMKMMGSRLAIAKRRPRQVVSKAMRAVKGKDTAPELALRKALWAHGFRYRLHKKSLPGKPDLVFASRRVTLFIDGDYWHGRQWKKRGFVSLEAQMSRVNNSEYWIKKIGRAHV